MNNIFPQTQVPEAIPFPQNWYTVVGHIAPDQEGLVSVAASQPVFSAYPTPDQFIPIVDNNLQQISFSSLAAVQQDLAQRGFQFANDPTDPYLWIATPPAFYWIQRYDFVRIIVMRVVS